MKRVVSTKTAPEAIGPYNQATIHQGKVYVSGQIAIDPISNEWVGGSIEEETHRVLKNVEAVLAASGSDLSLVLHCSIFVTDMADYPVINEIYSEYFPVETAPARALVEVSALPKGALLEMTVVAAVKE